MSAEVFFVEEIANDEKSFVGKSVRVLGRVKKVNGRERKLYITNATDSWLTTKKRKEDGLDNGYKNTILVSTVDVQPTFQFKKSMLYTFIGEFVLTDPSSGVSLPGSSSVVGTKVDHKLPQSEKYALRPRIVLQSEGIDFHLYRKCIILRRKFIAEQFGENANSRKDKTSDPNDENSSNSGKEPTTVAASFTPAENGAKRIKLSVTDGK